MYNYNIIRIFVLMVRYILYRAKKRLCVAYGIDTAMIIAETLFADKIVRRVKDFEHLQDNEIVWKSI